MYPCGPPFLLGAGDWGNAHATHLSMHVQAVLASLSTRGGNVTRTLFKSCSSMSHSVPHAPNKITVFAAQDYRVVLHVFVPSVTQIAVFAAHDYRDVFACV